MEDKLTEDKTAEVKKFRRRSPRREFFNKLGVLFKGKYQIENSLEVGEQGLLLSSAREYKKGERIVVSFYIPGSGFCIFRAIVRYQRPENNELYGLEFENLEFQERRRLRKFVAEKINFKKGQEVTVPN